MKTTLTTQERIARRPLAGSVPNAETLPLPEAKPFRHREGVHIPQPHRPTLLAPTHCSEKHLAGRPYADTLTTRQTRITGKENRQGWRIAQPTPKLQAKRGKAQQWAATHGKAK